MVTVWGTRRNHVCELGPRTHWTSVPDLAVTLSTSAPRAQEPLRRPHGPAIAQVGNHYGSPECCFESKGSASPPSVGTSGARRGCRTKPSAKTWAERAVMAVADAQGPDVNMVALSPSDESHDFRPHP